MPQYRWENETEIDRASSFFRDSRVTAPVCDTRTAANRSAPNERDLTLSSLATRWIETLPEKDRPVFLCEHFARIVNRIAMCWPDATLTANLFKDDYFRDKRGGRRGFPSRAKAELKALYAMVTQRTEGRSSKP